MCITKQGRVVKFEQNAVDYIAVECSMLNCKAVGDASGTVQQNVVFTAVQFVAEQWGVMGLDHFANGEMRHQLILILTLLL